MKIIRVFLSKLKWVFFSNIYSAMSKFIILIMIAQVLTPTEVGIYTLGLAITAPIALLFNMKMKSIIITEKEPSINMFKNIRVLSNVFAIILLLVISYIFYKDYLIIFALIGIIKILDLNSEFYQSLPNKNKDFHITSKLIFSKFTIIIVSFVLTLLITESLTFSLIVYIVSQLIHLIFESKYFNRYVLDEYKKNNVSYLFILSFMIPLGITQMLYSFGSSLPKYLLENLATIEEVGIFSAILYFVTIVNMLMSAIFQTVLPYAMDKYNNSKNQFNKIIFIIAPLFSLLLCAALYVPIFLWGENILRIIYGEIYAEYHYLLYILVITIYFNIIAWVFDSALLISRSIKLQPIFNLINIIITGIAAWYLINLNALIGATIAITLYQFINFIFKFLYYFIRGKNL